MNLSRYSKFLVALIPAVLAGLKVLSDALGDGQVTQQEWTALAIAFVAALAVFAVPNTKPAGVPYDPTISEREVKP